MNFTHSNLNLHADFFPEFSGRNFFGWGIFVASFLRRGPPLPNQSICRKLGTDWLPFSSNLGYPPSPSKFSSHFIHSDSKHFFSSWIDAVGLIPQSNTSFPGSERICITKGVKLKSHGPPHDHLGTTFNEKKVRLLQNFSQGILSRVHIFPHEFGNLADRPSRFTVGHFDEKKREIPQNFSLGNFPLASHFSLAFGNLTDHPSFSTIGDFNEKKWDFPRISPKRTFPLCPTFLSPLEI